MAYAYFGSVNLGSLHAAATIAATVVDATGAALGTQPTRTVVDLGGGCFGISIPAMPAGHTGWIVLQEGATVLDVLPVSPAEVETASVVWAGAPPGASPADIAAAVWAGAPPGTPLADIAAAVWAGAPPGTPLADIAAAVWAAADKAGYTLAPTGLDAIPMTLNSAPTNFREWFVWLTLRFRRTRRVKSTGAISIYGSDGSTVVTTQASADTSTEQTTGVPS
jgi:hypothetical protein